MYFPKRNILAAEWLVFAEIAILVTLFATETSYSVLEEENDGDSFPGLTESDFKVASEDATGFALTVTVPDTGEPERRSPVRCLRYIW